MSQTTKIVFFVPPGVHMLDLSGPVQAFLAATQMLPGYEIRYCAFRGDIADSSGLHLTRLTHYSDIDLQDGDYLFIPGFSRRLLDE